MSTPDQRRSAGRPGQRTAGTAVTVDDGPPASDGTLCTCCDPRNPLVARPDLGTLGDGSAEFALCVLHEPEPMVYRNRGDGQYVQMPHLSLNAAGELVDTDGKVVARVGDAGFQRLSTVDDDAPPGPTPGGDPAPSGPGSSPGGAARPTTFHVDLSQDDFYAG